MYNSLDNQKKDGFNWSLNYQERMQQLRDLLTSKLDDEAAMLGLSLEPLEQTKKD